MQKKDGRRVLKVDDITGNKYGMLTVLGLSYTENRRSYWKVLCDCGNEVIKGRSYLMEKPKRIERNCGCLTTKSRMEVFQKNNPNKTHGMSGTRLYKIWLKMKERCYNVNYPERELYGGRGIEVCEEWRSDFLTFMEWADENGYEEHLSIDRIDPNKNYEPNNCRWATIDEQADNKRTTIYLEYDGKRMTMNQWAAHLGIPVSTIRNRYHRKKSIEEILLPKKLRN